MAKRVILAVAGSGKTYKLCNEIDPNKKNLILAYTNENIHNIKKELLAIYGQVPDLTNVMTVDSFFYRYLLKPYELTIFEHFGVKSFVSEGVTLKEPESPFVFKKGERSYNPKYHKKNTFEHYICNKRYYCQLIPELLLEVSGATNLISKLSNTINKFYDYVAIDEFQDFREDYYSLIISIVKGLDNVLLVGDYYQHSVLGRNNSGKPFKCKDHDVDYNEYVLKLKKENLTVDDSSMHKSRRCPDLICQFVESKLDISIEANNENDGEVIWCTKDNIREIFDDDSIIKLLSKNSSKFQFNAINWSYSKGDTYDNTCVILTGTFNDLRKPDFSTNNISQISINQLYVALTRTKGNLYLVDKKLFDSIKDKYVLIDTVED